MESGRYCRGRRTIGEWALWFGALGRFVCQADGLFRKGEDAVDWQDKAQKKEGLALLSYRSGCSYIPGKFSPPVSSSICSRIVAVDLL